MFVDELSSFHYPEYDLMEFDRIITLWNDVEYLEEFFEANQSDLASGFWGGISVDEAIIKTITEANSLEKKIIHIAKNLKAGELDHLFKKLDKSTRNKGFERQKVYGLSTPTWLRIYALKVDNHYFCITGGAIKLTEKMNGISHLDKELMKMDRCNSFFKSQGIVDVKGLLELVI
jgi:hypothetical protein